MKLTALDKQILQEAAQENDPAVLDAAIAQVRARTPEAFMEDRDLWERRFYHEPRTYDYRDDTGVKSRGYEVRASGAVASEWNCKNGR